MKKVKAMAQTYTTNKGSVDTHTLLFDKRSPLGRHSDVLGVEKP